MNTESIQALPKNQRRKHFPTHFMRLVLPPYQEETEYKKRKENYSSIFFLNINTKILNKMLATIHNDKVDFIPLFKKRLVQYSKLNQYNIP